MDGCVLALSRTSDQDVKPAGLEKTCPSAGQPCDQCMSGLTTPALCRVCLLLSRESHTVCLDKGQSEMAVAEKCRRRCRALTNMHLPTFQPLSSAVVFSR